MGRIYRALWYIHPRAATSSTTITSAESWRLQLVLLLMRLLFSGRFVSPPQPLIQRGFNQDAHAQSPTRNEMEILPCALGMARH